MSNFTNEGYDARYESFYGSKEEWIKAKLTNGVENNRAKDLKDFLEHIEHLESLLAFRTQMFRKVDEGHSLFVTTHGKNIIQIDEGAGEVLMYTDDNRDFIVVVQNGDKACLCLVDK